MSTYPPRARRVDDAPHRGGVEPLELAAENPERAESVVHRPPRRALLRNSAVTWTGRCARSRERSRPRPRPAPPPASPAPWSSSNAVLSPAFGSVQLDSTSRCSARRERPDPRRSRPTASRTPRRCSWASRRPRTSTRADRVSASIREIVPAPSFELITHTQSSEAATSVGVLPTGIAARARATPDRRPRRELGGASSESPEPSVSASTDGDRREASSAAPA